MAVPCSDEDSRRGSVRTRRLPRAHLPASSSSRPANARVARYANDRAQYQHHHQPQPARYTVPRLPPQSLRQSQRRSATASLRAGTLYYTKLTRPLTHTPGRDSKAVWAYPTASHAHPCTGIPQLLVSLSLTPIRAASIAPKIINIHQDRSHWVLGRRTWRCRCPSCRFRGTELPCGLCHRNRSGRRRRSRLGSSRSWWWCLTQPNQNSEPSRRPGHRWPVQRRRALSGEGLWEHRKTVGMEGMEQYGSRFVRGVTVPQGT